MLRATVIALILWIGLCGIGGGATGRPAEVVSSPELQGDDPPAATSSAADQADLIDRILTLRQQLAELEGRLSPESKRRLENRLTELESSRDEAPGALEAAIPAAKETCNTLRLFDTSGDGLITGADRYWRNLRLWIDSNRNELREDTEVTHPFEHGIVEISGELKNFTTADGSVGDIRREDRLYFEPVGEKNETGVLLVKSSRIRGSGGLEVRSASGEILEGLQEFRPGMTIKATASGEEVVLNCP